MRKGNLTTSDKSNRLAWIRLFCCKICAACLNTRQQLATTANTALTMLHWQVGNRIRRFVLDEQRAEYGQRILATVSQELVRSYGKGFTVSSLMRVLSENS